MSPRTTFQSCGSSSTDRRRSSRPMRVMRVSPLSTANPAPTFSAPTIIVRSFRSSKSTPSLPTRVCLYSTGPPSWSFTASAPAASTGLVRTSPVPAIATSSTLFTDRLPVRGDAAAHVVHERDESGPGDEDVVARDPDQSELQPERHVVDPAGTEERDRGGEEHDVQDPGAVAQQPVRDDLEAV